MVFILPLNTFNPVQAQNILDQDDVVLIDSLRSNKIYFHTNMSLVLKVYHPQIVENIKLGIDTTSTVIPVVNVDFRVIVFPERTIPRIGMSGVDPNKTQIYILLDPAHPKLNEAINIHIVQTIPHEYHHTLRHRNVSFSTTLFEALISEGLASHFAIEVCKMDTPRYCKGNNTYELNYWREQASKTWFSTDYDYYDWFVGRTKPRNIGYAIGFSLVEDYLKLNPGKSAASLYATPAKKFLPHNKFISPKPMY